ncbi:Aste57867_16925 [Aphanomyces stellatus]|uniref:Aste57867_16925 protein n=1 Tax=Aphanomyces stellatus TaxID=120398 RepID=A0A485L7C1_9STRA|nr:hypothetical protein As57867_016867 [Aphanomyces stellatus]VFT93687.1 Aste57867_16925 [Aphanomyces stellatus]
MLCLRVAAVFLLGVLFAHAQVPVTPFPGTSPCQQCANNPAFCNVAYKGLPGQYCGPWLSSGVKQACCCPTGARCVIPIKADSCGCDSDLEPTTSKLPFWVWILVAVGVVTLAAIVCTCCCTPSAQPEPMYVSPGGVIYQAQPVVVQPGYGYGSGYGGGQVAAGIGVGAAAGILGGVLIGEAIADANRYDGGGYDGGGYGGDGGGGGGADFGGDF